MRSIRPTSDWPHEPRQTTRSNAGRSPKCSSRPSSSFVARRQLNSCARAISGRGSVRKAEYKRLTSRPDRKYIKGYKYVLLSHRENLSPEKRHRLKTLPKSPLDLSPRGPGPRAITCERGAESPRQRVQR